MPRYFFDVHDGIDVRDKVGRELEGNDAILHAEALQVVTELMKAEAADAKETDLILTVRDKNGRTAFRVRLICQIERS